METDTLSLLVAGGIVLFFIVAGLNIGVGLGIAGVVGTAIFNGNWQSGMTLPVFQSQDVGTAYMLLVIPLFIAMGTLAGVSKITTDLFTACYRWLGWVPGGVAVTTIGAGAMMSAIAGSTMAVSAAMARIAMPELVRYNYDKRLSLGSIAMGGTLAIMIPPSVTLVLYALFAEQSVGKLLIAGVVPGLMLAGMYIVLIIVRCRLNPKLGPAGPHFSWRDRFSALPSVLPFVGVVLSIVVGILAGIFTPVESAAIAVVIVTLICIWRRTLTWALFFEALLDAVLVSASVILIVIGSMVFSNFLALSGFTATVTKWVADAQFSAPVLIMFFVVLYLILGCLMETTSILALTVPTAVPMIVAVGLDPIWFGVIVVCLMEVGAVTPPVGLNLFVVKASIPEASIMDISFGSAPFWAVNIFAILIMYLFPGIATWLPSLM